MATVVSFSDFMKVYKAPHHTRLARPNAINTALGIFKRISKSPIQHGDIESIYLHEANNRHYYGGWMHPDDKLIFFVDAQSHSDSNEFLQSYFEVRLKVWENSPFIEHSSYPHMFADGWVRFVLPDESGSERGFEGLTQQLKKFSGTFWTKALSDSAFYVDLIDGHGAFISNLDGLQVHPENHHIAALRINQLFGARLSTRWNG